jgi:chromosome segregation ATPase
MSLEAADNSNTVVPVSLPTQSNSEMMRMEFGAFMMVETANYRELATRLDELGSELNEASRQLSLAASTEERLRQRVNDVEQTNASYAARLTQLTDEVANLKAIVAQRDTQIKSHEKEQRRLKEENRLLETRVAELNNQVQHLKKAVDYFRLTDDDVQLRIAAANVEKYLLQMIDPTYEFLDTLEKDAKIDPETAAKVERACKFDAGALKHLGGVIRQCKTKGNERVHGSASVVGVNLLLAELQKRLPHKMAHRDQVIATVKSLSLQIVK